MKKKDGFAKKKDDVTNWEAVYYNSGLFKYIK
jgi:hypothetical protein